MPAKFNYLVKQAHALLYTKNKEVTQGLPTNSSLWNSQSGQVISQMVCDRSHIRTQEKQKHQSMCQIITQLFILPFKIKKVIEIGILTFCFYINTLGNSWNAYSLPQISQPFPPDTAQKSSHRRDIPSPTLDKIGHAHHFLLVMLYFYSQHLSLLVILYLLSIAYLPLLL